MNLAKPFEKIGDGCLAFLEQGGRMGIFLFACLLNLVKPPYPIFPVIRQAHFIGVRSLFVIIFTGAFTGMILGLQGYYTLTKFGS